MSAQQSLYTLVSLPPVASVFLSEHQSVPGQPDPVLPAHLSLPSVQLSLSLAALLTGPCMKACVGACTCIH